MKKNRIVFIILVSTIIFNISCNNSTSTESAIVGRWIGYKISKYNNNNLLQSYEYHNSPNDEYFLILNSDGQGIYTNYLYNYDYVIRYQIDNTSNSEYDILHIQFYYNSSLNRAMYILELTPTTLVLKDYISVGNNLYYIYEYKKYE